MLKFWWPRISYWNSFNVNVMSMDGQTNGTITRNRVTAIGNSTEPTGTKKQQINLIKTLKTGDAAGSISGFNNPTTAPTANTIVYRDAAGDISAREIVLSSGLSAQTPTVLVSMYPSTNQLVRTTPAAVAASMGALTTSNYNSYALPLTGGTVSGAILVGPTGGGAYTRFGQGAGDTTYSTISASNGNLHIDRQAGYDLYLNWYSARPVWSEGGAYFPIYYDRNDSAYYVNPTGSTSLRTVGDWRSNSGDWTGEFNGKSNTMQTTCISKRQVAGNSDGRTARTHFMYLRQV